MAITTTTGASRLDPTDAFVDRHVGPSASEIEAMLAAIGIESLDALIDKAVPKTIRMDRPLAIGAGLTEHALLAYLGNLADQNEIWRSYLGMGYSNTLTPPVIQRNILENPGWYTQYTPYQAEIAQGRLEALLNFQTVVSDLCGLPVANASLLDEGTAAAEAMSLFFAVNRKNKSESFFISERCNPQTIGVVRTRAEALGIDLVVADPDTVDWSTGYRGAILAYPETQGAVRDLTPTIAAAHEANTLVCVVADLLSLTLLKPPGEMEADVVVGNSQRFGVPFGYGGPHAAFMATRDAYKRQIPGRIVGMTKDTQGNPTLRLALQTREQHIRREKATSNICTAQVLLAIMASMYAVYHGPDGLRRIARRVHDLARALAGALQAMGITQENEAYFDTLCVRMEKSEADRVFAAAADRRINLRRIDDERLGIALDEAVTRKDIDELISIFAGPRFLDQDAEDFLAWDRGAWPEDLDRSSAFLTHERFNSYHSETEFLRYVTRLQARDLSLTTSMISLGSCTMKLNATAEMVPVTWPQFAALHPFAPVEQAQGYQVMFSELESMLAEVTGFHSVSLQPNAGSQGEYAGMLVIRAYQRARGEAQRNICLIPQSAHGTNPASAVMAGMKVVVVKCDENGNIDLADLKARCATHRENLAAIMVTYPSTHGVFEEHIREVCETVHAAGGQVYLDGANLNAQVGLCRPGDYGADVCHMNLHKTFCIPHGGGGPGMGPIGVAEHLAPFLPGHPVIATGGEQAIGPISAAPWGSSSILWISYAYMKMMGGEGLTQATRLAILGANYMAKRLEDYFPVLYRGPGGLSAHEFIIDLRPLKARSGIDVEDIAKRLMDYGFHAPTISFPVIGTIMIEPTESESQAELDRFCDAMIAIHDEIQKVIDGTWPKGDNPLENAPHTGLEIAAETWSHPYSRMEAAYPAPWLLLGKFWPPVKRADNVWGDRNLICACPPMEAYEDDA